MTISVLITTRNRAEILKRCLKSLERQSTRPNEVIVVDNDSSDNTKTVINSFRSLRIRYLFEKKIGIAFGRNRGLAEAKGNILAFIDDDCIASRNWIKEIEKSFKKNVDIVGIVGRSKNMFTQNPYACAEQCWFLYWYLKHISISNKEEILNDGELINFKNMALRKSFIRQTRFNTKLTTGKFSEEDTEIRKRLFKKLRLKEKITYQPKVIVYHKNRSSFLQLLLRRFYKGVALAELCQKKKIITVNCFKRQYLFLKWMKSIVPEMERLDHLHDQVLCFFCIPLLPIFSKIGFIFYYVRRALGFPLSTQSDG
ncbi:glycosyltransferase [Candidatus Collierbacteria bacterium]|nr:glycosyltransferase [Candidatus Collierbacteria bacterium]